MFWRVPAFTTYTACLLTVKCGKPQFKSKFKFTTRTSITNNTTKDTPHFSLYENPTSRLISSSRLRGFRWRPTRLHDTHVFRKPPSRFLAFARVEGTVPAPLSEEMWCILFFSPCWPSSSLDLSFLCAEATGRNARHYSKSAGLSILILFTCT